MNDKEKQLLKEFVKNKLKHLKQLNEYGDAFGEFDAGNKSDLAKIFLEPLTDLAGVIKGSIAKISSRARTAIEVSLKGIPTLIVPGLSYDYSKLFQDEKIRIDKIKEKYKDVFAKTDKALGSDAQLLSFMLNPTRFIASTIVIEAPGIIPDLLGVIGGDAVGDAVAYAKKKMGHENKKQYLAKHGNKGIGIDSIDQYIGNDTNYRSTDAISHKKDFSKYYEGAEPKNILQESKMTQIAMELLNNPSVKKALQNSQALKDIQTQAKSSVNETVSNIEKNVNNLLGVQSLEELEKVLNKKINLSSLEKIDPKEQEIAKQILLTQTKKAVIETYIDLAKKNLEEFQTSNIPESSYLAQLYSGLISRLSQKL